MSTRTLRLNYPPSLASRPVLNHLIRQFEVTVNIRQAHITLEEGWLEAEFSGPEDELDRATAWLEQEGVMVDHIA